MDRMIFGNGQNGFIVCTEDNEGNEEDFLSADYADFRRLFSNRINRVKDFLTTEFHGNPRNGFPGSPPEKMTWEKFRETSVKFRGVDFLFFG